MSSQIKSNKHNLSDYEDVLVVDNDGIVIFYDMSNLNLFDLKPDDVIGKKVTSLYKNFSDETSTLMAAVRYGKSNSSYKQKLITKRGRIVYQISSTFPIMDGDSQIGAIEFSKHLYNKDTVNFIKDHSIHKVYRKNNTIYTIDDIITNDSKMQYVKEKIKKAGNTDSSILIYGSTGTGKEMVAQAIHNYSNRRVYPFVSLNCGAIPSTLLESTLYGTVKGSYTGAEDNMGLFEAANNGTLFLDEINSMDTIMQVKLLKAVEEKRIRRVGSTNSIDLNVRIIAAVNQDLGMLIKNEVMREDLFYRLSVVQINLPNLRDRIEDIECLTNYYINYYNERFGMSIEGVSLKVMEIFKKYDWPGNIRELKHVIEGAYNNVSSNVIEICDISDRLLETNINPKLCLPSFNSVGLKRYLEECEEKIIRETIEMCNGNMSESARNLKISRQLLKYKIEKYY